MSAADQADIVTPAQAQRLFAGLSNISADIPANISAEDSAKYPALLLAVSGGPDSTALLVLAARWRKSLKAGPALYAATVDHGLRPQSGREAEAVARLATKLGVPHRILKWTGRKPKTGLPEAAREARYRLLAREAQRVGARHVLTAHTLDDQAETVLIRLLRGSGFSGLAAMTRESALCGVQIVRPFLDVPKASLIATLRASRIGFASDPTNRDVTYTRARLRAAMPMLAKEGLTAARLARLATRIARAEAAIQSAVADAAAKLSLGPWAEGRRVVLDGAGFARLPEEIALRLLGRAIAHAGDGSAVALRKLEALHAALHAALGDAKGTIRRTLAGAMVTQAGAQIVIERAPARRSNRTFAAKTALTTRKQGASRPVFRR